MDNRFIISHRCFFPKGAFFWSTDKICGTAREVGYDGVEFLPTWRFVYEMKRYGKLLAPKEMVVSGHRDWRIDRVMLARADRKPGWAYQLKELADQLFPPTTICLRTLQQFQKVYGVPISTTWFDDTQNFSPVMLELHGYQCGVDEEELLSWLRKNPEQHGVVVDITKFPKWLETIGRLKEKDEIIEKLLPFVWEVHYRPIRKDNKFFLASLKEGKKILRRMLAWGYQGRIVVEFGWPDLEKAPFGLISEDIGSFKKLHWKVIASIISRPHS